MQAVQEITGTAIWPTVFSGGFVLAALGFLVRWVVAPASRAYVRDDLKPEIAQLASHEQRITRGEGRTAAIEAELEALKNVPVGIARIEARLDALHELWKPRSAP